MASTAWRVAVVATLVWASLGPSASAWAHENGEAPEAYLLVQQALAYLAQDSGPEGTEMAMEKVGDALETEDQDGVDVTGLRLGQEALEAGNSGEAHALLQESIGEALAELPPATGTETGTRLVPSPLPGRGPLDAADALALALCIAVAGVGVWLSVRFRPPEGLDALRRLMGAEPAPQGHPHRVIRMARHPR